MIYVLLNHVVTLLLSMQFTTVITFPTDIRTITYGGSQDEIFTAQVNENKTLVIKPLMAGVDSNLLVVTKDKQYFFYLKNDSVGPHKFVTILDGKKDSSFVVAKDTEKYTIFDGKTSVRVINKGKPPLLIDGQMVDRETFISKGAPVYIENVRVFN